MVKATINERLDESEYQAVLFLWLGCSFARQCSTMLLCMVHCTDFDV